MSKPDVREWVRTETPEHLALLTKLREKLTATLDTDVNENNTPSRDWCRAFQRYQAGWQSVEQAERERVKLKLLAKKAGEDPLSDEEFERELRDLAVEALTTLPPDVLTAELARRGQLQAALMPAGESDDA